MSTISKTTPEVETQRLGVDFNHQAEKGPSKNRMKTWTLDEIRRMGGFIDFHGRDDLLGSAADEALSRRGITSRTWLTAEDVREIVREVRERLEMYEEDMESFLEDNYEAADKILEMISEG